MNDASMGKGFESSWNSQMKEDIWNLTEEILRSCEKSMYYRDPIIGYADAKDPLYEKLDDIIGNKQMRPDEMLSGAATVIVIFVPYSRMILDDVRNHWLTSAVYSDAYMVTNKLLGQISAGIIQYLKERNYRGVSDPPTENFDYSTKTACWSHKSSAVISGIGTFGLNHLLVTSMGCMGRMTSVVTDAVFSPTERSGHAYCLYYQKGTCRVCIQNCPSGALREDGTIDKWRCDSYLEGKNVRDTEQGCPQCQSGPCAMRGF